MSLIAELQRRNVIRVGIAYVAFAWLLIQVVETVLPFFGISEESIRVIFIVLAIGLVPTLVFAWVIELTPQGLQQALEIDPGYARAWAQLATTSLLIPFYADEPRPQWLARAEQAARTAIELPAPVKTGIMMVAQGSPSRSGRRGRSAQANRHPSASRPPDVTGTLGIVKYLKDSAMKSSKVGRRVFLRASLTAAAAAPLGAIPLVVRAEAKRLSEDNAQAAALGYRHDGSTVDDSKFPQHKAEQRCGNCQLFQGADGDEWGGCSIFAGKQVNTNGWCSAWVAK